MNINYLATYSPLSIDEAAKALLSLSEAAGVNFVPKKMSTVMEFSQTGEGPKVLKRTAPISVDRENFKKRKIEKLQERNNTDASSKFTFVIKTPGSKIRFFNYLSVDLPTTLDKVKEAARDYYKHLNLSKDGFFIADQFIWVKTDEELSRKINEVSELTIHWVKGR